MSISFPQFSDEAKLSSHLPSGGRGHAALRLLLPRGSLAAVTPVTSVTRSSRRVAGGPMIRRRAPTAWRQRHDPAEAAGSALRGARRRSVFPAVWTGASAAERGLCTAVIP